MEVKDTQLKNQTDSSLSKAILSKCCAFCALYRGLIIVGHRSREEEGVNDRILKSLET